jgi:Peptidase A4 family
MSTARIVVRCACSSCLLAALGLLPASAGAADPSDPAKAARPVILSLAHGSPFTAAGAPFASLSISRPSVPATGGAVLLRYSAANASSCTLSAAPMLWIGANPATVGCNGSYTARVPQGTARRRWRLTFTATSSSGRSASSNQTLTERAPAARASQTATWSGYVLPSRDSPVTEASGRWTVPRLDCSTTPNSGAYIWVGIGGYKWPAGGTSGTLLQTGIRADCTDGDPDYAGWFEEYPSTPNTAKEFSGFPLSAGDVIEASVYERTGGGWETRVDDLTTGLSGVMVTGEGWGVEADSGNGTFIEQGSTVRLSYAGGTTAEWIVEDYSRNGSIVPFVDYGTVSFSNLTTSRSSRSLTRDDGVEIAQNGVVRSTPSPPARGGFSVTYRPPPDAKG